MRGLVPEWCVRQPTEHVWPIPVIDLSLTVDESRSVDPREGQGDGIANCPVPGNYVHGHCHLVRQRSEMGNARHQGGSMATSGPVNDLNQHPSIKRVGVSAPP